MEKEYVVQEGDTLSEILYNHTGDGSYEYFVEIAEKNGITDPDHIEPGQTIRFTVPDSYTGAPAGTGASTPGYSSGTGSNSTSSPTSNTSGPGGSMSGGTGSNNSGSRSSGTGSNSSSRGNSSGSNSSNSNKGTAVAAVAASSVAGKVSNATSAFDFSYYYEDDTITYDIDNAKKMLEGPISDDISAISMAISELSSVLSELQENAQDIPGTKVEQDYKDMESLMGEYYSGTGIVGFNKDALSLCNEIYDNVCELEMQTYK